MSLSESTSSQPFRASTSGNSSNNRGLWLWAMTMLLILFCLTRIYHLMALPLFIDEASHITRAQNVWLGKPLYLLETGKALVPYVAALFWPFSGAPFIGRYVVVLFGLLGVASAYAVGRELHSRAVGVLAVILWIGSTQLLFFERMALVDAALGSLTVLVLWLSIRSMRSGRALTAIMCGLVLMLAVLCKLTGLVFAPIPVLVALLLPLPRLSFGKRIKQVVLTYVIFGVLMGAFVLYLVSIQVDPTGQSSGLTTTSTTGLAERLQANIGSVWNAFDTYLSPVMFRLMLGALGAGIIFASRRTVLLLILVLLFMGAINAAAATLWLRYTVSVMPLIVVMVALGLITFTQTARRIVRLPRVVEVFPWLVSAVWIFLVGVPFFQTAYTHPADLNLPSRDRTEYIEWIPSGFGVRDAAQYLQRTMTKPATVIGTIVNCNAARLYMPLESPIKILCPDLDWGGGNPDAIALINTHTAEDGTTYVIREYNNPETVSLDALPTPQTLIQTFERPGNRHNVSLYLIGSNVVGDKSPASVPSGQGELDESATPSHSTTQAQH